MHRAFIAIALLPPLVMAWVLWLAPVGGLQADRVALAARDFTALWSAGRLAIAHATAALADPALFTARLRDWFGPGMPDQIWPYPPPALLLADPLARLPLASSFLLYTTATLVLLYGVLRLARLSSSMCVAVLLSPAIAENALIGQNGALIAAMLAGGLLLAESRPTLAGLLLGALVLKPQFALLLPFCLFAGHRRIGLIALGTAVGLVVLSWVCFGQVAWMDYVDTARPAVAAYFEAPWRPGGAQQIFASAFIAARSLGASLTTAYAVQGGLALLCAVLAVVAWRRPDLDVRCRAALTIALTCAASPWIHSYDMPALAVAIVMLAPATTTAARPLLALAWFWPGAVALIGLPSVLPILSTCSIAGLAWRRAELRRAASTGTI